jgi:DNA processing protein
MNSPSPSLTRSLAWAILARAALIAPLMIRDLLDADTVWDAVEKALAGQLDVDLPTDLRELAARDLERAAEIGARLLPQGHADWPGYKLWDLNTPSVRSISPIALWVQGTARINPFAQIHVAVTGTRTPTERGMAVASEIVAGLTEHGWPVISGGGHGIEQAAHRAVLDNGGSTIAVLATGLARTYPSAQREMFDRVAEDGLMVSEYPPDFQATRDQFIQRDRLMAALVRAVVVPEARMDPGTLNVVKWAHQLDRPVFAVPAPADATTCTGCDELIRTRRALPVADAADTIQGVYRTWT